MFSRRPRRLGLRSHRPANGLAIEGLSAAESLEMRRLMAVDVTLVGGVLTVAFDDALDDVVSLSINATGYEVTGANVSSGTGTISQLIVIDAGTAKSSDLTLLQADQTLTGGLSIASNVTVAQIEDSVTTKGGDISIGAGCLTSSVAITLDSAAGSLTLGGATNVAGDLTLRTTSEATIDIGRISSGGNLSVTTGGNVRQSGSLSVTGTTTITGGTAANSSVFYEINLPNAGNSFGGAVSANGVTDVYLSDSDAIVLGPITAGSLTVATPTGGITGAGPLVVSGGTFLTAGSSDITLLGANNFGSIDVTSGRNVSLADVSGIQFLGVDVSGNLSITANGELTDFGDINVTGTTTLAAGATNDITLDNANDFGGAVTITSGRNITLNATNGLALSSSTVSGSLIATAAGAITQSGVLDVFGNVTITARNIVITADLVSTSGDISLTGDAGSTVSGAFHGVHVNGSGVEVKTLATDLIAGATGSITVQGRGGDAVAAGSGTSRAHGVYLQAGAVISAGGTGDMSVTGVGGVSTTDEYNSGVLLSNSNAANGVSEIVTAGGNITVTGTAGGATGASINYGVSVNSFARISAGGTGSISVTGTATETGGTLNSGVSVNNFNAASQATPTAAITSAGGEITVTGTGTSTAGGEAVVLRNAGQVTSGGSGNVTIIADSVIFDTDSAAAAGSITAGAAGNATVAIRPRTNGTLIDLGGFDSLTSPLTLGLTTAEIDQITAGTLSVGSTTAGVATVSTAITPANVTNLVIRSAAGVSLAGHITTDGGTITIDDGAGGDTAVALANSGLLDTTNSGGTPAGAAVTIRGTVTSNTSHYPLQIQAGTDGDVLVSDWIGVVGGGEFLQSVIIVGNDISLAGIDGVVGNTYVEANDGTDTGSITLTGLTYATTGGFTLSAGPRDGFNMVSNPITLTGGTAGSNTTFTTAGNLIELSGAIDLNGRNLAIDTTAGGANATGAAVFVNDAIDGAGTLSIDAGTGDAGSGGEVSVNHLSGAVGGTTPLTAVTLTNAREANFGRAVNAGTLSLLDATENIVVQGVMNLTTGLVTAAEPYNLTFLGGSADTSVIAGATTFLNTGTVRLGDQGGDAFTFSGGVVATAPASIVLSAAIGATTGVITLGDADTGILAGGGAAIGGVSTGNITIGDLSFADGAGIILGTGIANAIEVNAISGTAGAGAETVEINTLGPVAVTGTIGGGLSSFTITNSGGTTFQDSVAAGVVAITDTTGTVTFEAALTSQSLLTNAEPYAVALLGDGSEIVNAAVFDNTGGVTIGNATADTITFTGGLMSQAGPTTIAGTVVTADFEARFGAVAVTADSVINASSGNVSFAGAIDGAHALTVQSTGLTSFGGAIGGTTPLASLTTDAGGTTTIAGGGVTTTGNQTYGDPVNLTADTVITAGGELSLGNLTATGNLTLTGLTVDVTGDIVSGGKLTEIQSTAGNITIAGGISADNLAGSAGFITVETLGVGNISITGNLSAVGGNGGDGGLIGVYGNEAIALAGIDASGGDSATGAGGWAGWVTVASDDSVITVSGQIAANGGEAAGVSAAGGNGGIVSLVGNNSLISFGSVTIDGGSSANGLGGDGGALFAGNGTATGLLTMGGNLSARGGSGSTGGGAGGSLAILSPVNLSAALDLNTTSPGSADGSVSLNRVDGPYAVTVAGGLELTGNLVVAGLSTSDAATVYGNLTIATGAGQLTLAGGVSQPTGTTSILTLGDANQTGNVTIAGDTVVLHGLEIAAGNFDVSLNVVNGTIQNTVDFLNNGTLTLEHAVTETQVFMYVGGINASGVAASSLNGELYSSNAAFSFHNLTTVSQSAILTTPREGGPGAPIVINGLNTTGGLGVGPGIGHNTTLLGNVIVNGGLASYGALVVPGNLTLAGLIASLLSQTYTGSLTLAEDSTLDSTFLGFTPGAPIALAGTIETNGHQLTISTGDQPVEVLANLSANGSIDLPTNSLSVGNETTSATISSQGNLTLTVGGTLGVTSGSAIDVGPNDLTLRVNGLDVAANAAGLTAGLLTLAPATAGTNIFLGAATGAGLVVPESVFDAINAPVVQVGEAGFNGTVELGSLNLTASRLDIVADGVGGRVVQNGSFVSTATGTPGNIGLLVEGSGGTYVLNGSITSASDVVINDALEVSGGSWAIDTQATGATITITGGNANGSAGIYATLGELNSLTLNAGTGTIALGSSAGFGDASGTGALLDNVEITGGQTLLSASTSTIGGGLIVNGPIDLTGDGAFSVTDTIAVGGQPFGIAFSPDGMLAYVANQVSDTVSVIDVATNFVIDTIPTGSSTGPRGVALSPDGSRLYVTNLNNGSVTVIDTATNMLVTTVPVGDFPSGVAVSPDGTVAYVANQLSDSISVIDTSTNTVTGTIAVGGFPSAVAFHPDGTRAYVTNSNDATVSVIDTATETAVATIGGFSGPHWIAITPDGNTAYVSNFGSDTVSVIDTSTDLITTSIAVGQVPFGIAISGDGLLAFVANQASSTVSVIDTTTNTVVSTIAVGSQPIGVAVGPSAGQVYVTDVAGNSVTVIAPPTISISTTRQQFYGGAVAIPVGTTLTALNVTFGSTVDGNGSLTVNSQDFNSTAPIGDTTPLAAMTVSGTSQIRLGNNITTVGPQQYGSPGIGWPTLFMNGTFTTANESFRQLSGCQTVLTGNVTINTGTGAIGFAITNGQSAGGEALTLITTGATAVGTLGRSTPLASVNITGGTASLGGVHTTGPQTYGGDVILRRYSQGGTIGQYVTDNATFSVAGNATLDSGITACLATGSGTIAFNGTIDGPACLSLASTGQTFLNGTIGGTTPLVDLTTAAGSNVTLDGDVTTTGNQTFLGDLTLASNATLTAGTPDNGSGGNGSNGSNGSNGTGTSGSILFGGSLAPVALTQTLSLNATTNITLPEIGRSTAPFAEIDALANLTLLTGNITTIADQTYRGRAAATQDLDIVACLGTITFGGGLDSSDANLTPNVSIQTAGDVVFSAPVGGTPTGQLFHSTYWLGGLNVTAGNITLAGLGSNSAVSSVGATSANLTVTDSACGTLNFTGLFYAVSGDARYDAAGSTYGYRFTSPTAGTALVRTVSGDLEFVNGDISLAANVSLEAIANSGGRLLVNGDIDGVSGEDVTLYAFSDAVVINGTIGSGTGTIGNVSISGGDSLRQPVLLQGDIFAGLAPTNSVFINGNIALSGDRGIATAGDISISGPIDADPTNGGALQLLTASNVTLTQAVGQNDRLSNLTIFANATSLGGPTIATTGPQTYTSNLTLAADIAIDTANNDVAFQGTIDGARQLGITAGTGNVSFFQALGSTTPLQGLNLASAAAVEALSTIAIDGTGGSSHGLQIGADVDNVNLSQPGSTIANAALSGISLAGGSTDSTLGGFTVTNSGGVGVDFQEGSYFDSTFGNSTVIGSGSHGILMNNVVGLTIRETRSSGNARSGIAVFENFTKSAKAPVTIQDSIIGLDASGTAAQPNLGQGLILSGTDFATVSNTNVGGNGQYGIVVTGGATDTTITGNRIGLGADGTTAIGNGQSGVFVLGGATGTTIVGNRISNNSGMAGIQVVDGTSNTTIGGSGPSANLLVNNGLFGITVSGDVPGTRVLGNLVSSHTTANLYLNNAQNLTVGSTTSGEENTFDGSDYGVYAGGDLTGTTIAGNTFQQHTLGGVVLTEASNLTVRDNTLDDNGAYGIYGTGELAGTTLQGNTISNHTVGVLVDNGTNLTIGSATGTATSDPDTNTITKNSYAGVVVSGAGSQNVSILSNSIFENDFIGISLAAGGNALARTPTLATASTTEVTGSITGTNGDVFRIQYFKSVDDVTSSSRFAQGEELLGYEDVTISSGTAALAFDLSSSSVIVTDWITATATLLVGGLPSETSQFSFGIRVTA